MAVMNEAIHSNVFLTNLAFNRNQNVQVYISFAVDKLMISNMHLDHYQSIDR